HVPLLKSSGIFFKVRERIFSGINNPEDVHLHGNVFRIQFREHYIVRNLSVGLHEFESVIVIGESDAILVADLPCFVELLATPLVIIDGCSLILPEVRTYHVFLTNGFCISNSLLPAGTNDVNTVMTTGDFHSEALDIVIEFFDRHSEKFAIPVPVGLQLLVSKAGDFLEYPFWIFGHGLAKCIQLKSEAVLTLTCFAKCDKRRQRKQTDRGEGGSLNKLPPLDGFQWACHRSKIG